MKKHFCTVLLLFLNYASVAQTAVAFYDSSFYRMILLYHPVAKQAQLYSPLALAELQTARGLFDPTVRSSYSIKEFDSKTYWKHWENELTVPLLPGIDLKGGYSDNSGVYLDPEQITPDKGLVSAGIKVPLGQGLFIDERRNTLGQARLFAELADADRRKLLNKLMLEATSDYYEWYYNYQRYRLFDEFLRLSEIRLEAIRQRVIFGDLPAIDSLEASMEVENRTLLRNQARIDYLGSQLRISGYLWNDAGQPLQVTDSLVPQLTPGSIQRIDERILSELLILSGDVHPELNALETRIEQMDFERRWAAEKLKPKLNLDYTFLTSGDNRFFQDYNFSETEDYKFGINFSMPLFLRGERGKLTGTKIKIQQLQYRQKQLQRDLSLDVTQAWNEVNNFSEQVEVQRRQLLLAEQMLSGENERFFAGEGSLFLVNAREAALINNRIRLAEFESKYHKSLAGLYWSAGNLGEIRQ